MRRLTHRVIPLAVALGLLPACPFCEDIDVFLAQGTITPPVLDLGPITTGATCSALFAVDNVGNADLTVVANSARLLDTDGDFTIQRVPSLIRLGASEELAITYVAGTAIGEREGTAFEFQTNDPDNDGFLRASVTAFVAGEAVGIAKTSCAASGANADDDGAVSPCQQLSFGAVPIGDPFAPILERTYVTKTVVVINDGTKDLTLQGAVVSGGADFAVLGVKRGSQEVLLPQTVPPGRSGECGASTGADNTLLVDVVFAPTTLGGAVATLQILTDGAEGSLLEVALSGEGADTNILTNPEIVVFGDVAEGSVGNAPVLVQNTGTNDASVNESCIDLDDDGVCDGLCTGASADTTLNGTLRCAVFRADGSREGKGFVLSPTDAAVGGDDERTIEVTWSPTAATPAIPQGAKLLLKSNIKDEKVFEVRIVGGNIGVLDITSPTPCGPDLCVQAQGEADVGTWTGTTTLTLTNSGTATLTIATIGASDDTPSTIADDWTIGAPGSTSLTPGASTTVSLSYANDDASGQDNFNLIVEHNGVGGSSLASIRVRPPG